MLNIEMKRNIHVHIYSNLVHHKLGLTMSKQTRTEKLYCSKLKYKQV